MKSLHRSVCLLLRLCLMSHQGMILDGEGDSSAVSAIQGVAAIVNDPLTQLGAGTGPNIFPQGGLVSQQVMPQQVPSSSAPRQVMSPNAGVQQTQAQQGQQQQGQAQGATLPNGMPSPTGTPTPIQATQERVRGVQANGLPFEAQRVNIVWEIPQQVNNFMEKFRDSMKWLN